MFKLPKGRTRRVLVVLAAIVILNAVWYAAVRIAGPRNAIRLFAETNLEAAAQSVDPSRLRVGIYNIAHGRGTATSNWQGGTRLEREARLHSIAELLRDSKLDVAVLNEVDFDSNWSHRVNQAEFLAREAGFSFRVEQRNIDCAIPFFSLRFGNAVLSRFPIQSVRLVDFPSYSKWESILAGKKKGVSFPDRNDPIGPR